MGLVPEDKNWLHMELGDGWREATDWSKGGMAGDYVIGGREVG